MVCVLLWDPLNGYEAAEGWSAVLTAPARLPRSGKVKPALLRSEDGSALSQHNRT